MTAGSALRIGLLGASRIAEESITDASRETGDVRAAVAARDPERARAYAAEHDYAGVRESYEALLADDELDLVYIGLPNGLHAEWTIRAVEAGRNVLVEKPFAANLSEFDAVAEVLSVSPGRAWEAFHYADHPLFARLIDIVQSGEIGSVESVNVAMAMPAPEHTDPRWNFELAGGTMMDLGCYAINGLLVLGEVLGLQLELRGATAQPYAADPRVDATVHADFVLGELPATLFTSMEHDGWDFSFEVIGTSGSVLAPNFVKPQQDDRLIVRVGSIGAAEAEVSERIEHAGSKSSYVHQLERIRSLIARGDRDEAGLHRSRRTMELIDAVYQASGMPLRPSRLPG